MNKNLETKNFIWNAIGLSFYAFNSLFIMIAVTRINGLKIAGMYSYSFSLCCLFYYVAMYFNRAYQVSYDEKNFDFYDFFSFRLIASLFSLVMILLFSIISCFNFYKLIMITILILIKIVEAISECFYADIHKKNNLYYVGMSLTYKSLFGLLTFIVVDYLFKNVIIALFFYLIVNLIGLICFDKKKFNSLNSKFVLKFNKLKNFKNILFICFPIFAFSFLGNLLCNMQKLIITYFLTDEVQSIFGIIIMPATVLSLVGNYLINPFINKFNDFKHKHEFKKFNLLVLKLCAMLISFGIFAMIVIYLIGVPILNFIYNVKLYNYRLDLVIIILSAVFYSLTNILSCCMTIIGENRKQLYLFCLSTIISLFFSILFIDKFLINGAIYAYLISCFFHCILYILVYVFVVRKEEVKWKKK